MILTQCQGCFWQLRQAVESGGATECHNISRYAHNTEKYVAFQQKTSDFDSNTPLEFAIKATSLRSVMG